MRHALEGEIKRHLQAESAILLWLIVWTEDRCKQFKVGCDGNTCFERIPKHGYKHEVFGFGESVIWQMDPDENDRNKLESDFCDGIFPGVSWRSEEFNVGTREGIFKCQTIKPRPTVAAHDPECIDYITTS